jgi:xanthine dehydrogenase small subunit
MVEPTLTVNGRLWRLDRAGAHTSTLDWLRESGLTGTKEGCAEGECGACAVMIAQPDGSGRTEWTSVNSCLLPVAALNGQEIVTSEGLGTPEALHPVQAELAAGGSSQCGYCTPGFACSMAAEFYRRGRSNPAGSTDDPAHAGDDHEHGPNGFDLHALSGNLCRCTGYRPIRDAAFALGDPEEDDVLAERRDHPAPEPVPTDIDGPDGRFVRANSLAEAVTIIAQNPTAVLVAGSTDWGVEVNLRGRRTPLIVDIDRIPELRSFEITDRYIEIGAGLTLSEVERMLAGRVPMLATLIPQFASQLIRNRATIGGNLGTASPIGDTPPALLALGSRLILSSTAGDREVELDTYFTGYRETVRAPDELIRAIRIPLPLATLVAFHKIAKRRYDDISSVAIAFAIQIEDGVVRHARIGLGGIAATPLRARSTEHALVGQAWTEQTVGKAAVLLGAEGTPLDDHRASAAYRRSMLAQSLIKLFVTAKDGREASHEFTV